MSPTTFFVVPQPRSTSFYLVQSRSFPRIWLLSWLPAKSVYFFQTPCGFSHITDDERTQNEVKLTIYTLGLRDYLLCSVSRSLIARGSKYCVVGAGSLSTNVSSTLLILSLLSLYFLISSSLGRLRIILVLFGESWGSERVCSRGVLEFSRLIEIFGCFFGDQAIFFIGSLHYILLKTTFVLKRLKFLH